MIARMTGKAPLLLASFLFGVGVTGLVITTAERAEWGPFQPQTRTPAPQEVVVVQVGPEITPPPLRIINVASDAEPEATPEETASPAVTPEDQAELQPQTGCNDCEDIGGVSDDEGAGPILAAGKSGHAIPGNANGLLRRAEADGGANPAGGSPGNPGPASRER